MLSYLMFILILLFVLFDPDSDKHSNGSKANSIKSAFKKHTSVSAFGSITAQMNDGMTIALSQFGDSGEAPDGMWSVFVRKRLQTSYLFTMY